MKKLLALVCSFATVIVFSACVSGTENPDTTDTPTNVSTDGSTDKTSTDSTSTDASDTAATFTEAPFGLVSGTPPIPDPSPLVYKGNVKLSGWIIYKPAYAGEEVAHFRVADENFDKLPEEIKAKHKEFLLVVIDENGKQQQISQSIIDEITAASEASTATIIVDGLRWGMEGSPSLYFVELVTE